MQRILRVAMVWIALAGVALAAADANPAIEKIVVQIQRADYEGNRVALKQLYEDLAAFLENRQIVSRVRYWRGFALWRRALNGFNESVNSEELARDLELAASEFKEASRADDHFVDAKIGEGSCLSNLMYLNRGNRSRLENLMSEARQVFKEAEAQAPDNPRLAWVQGPNLWYSIQQNRENQLKAIALYERGLETIRAQKKNSGDTLEPSWGEPELLMNLAWSNLHRETPDLKAAQSYAQSALTLVPYWHYVKDILIPQIQNAMDTTEIQKLREKDIAASKAGDFETLKSLFTKDSVVMPPGSDFVRGESEREKAMQAMREDMSHYEVLEYYENFEELKIWGGEAMEWGTISGKMRDKRTGEVTASRYKVMRILSKQATGDWKISRSIYNDLPASSH